MAALCSLSFNFFCSCSHANFCSCSHAKRETKAAMNLRTPNWVTRDCGRFIFEDLGLPSRQ